MVWSQSGCLWGEGVLKQPTSGHIGWEGQNSPYTGMWVRRGGRGAAPIQMQGVGSSSAQSGCVEGRPSASSRVCPALILLHGNGLGRARPYGVELSPLLNANFSKQWEFLWATCHACMGQRFYTPVLNKEPMK